ncbi:DUF1016 N-terminal domain-containing protein [Dyadobacter arcticus]|uniref:Nuclease of restriction endonuclease-like (RecB) superfamily n=1 Tax=Dyadobacter arcticus TaxID=1078754 RepID=A0ABX0UJ20_9BACT|nr:DUF1016 N-terminal domain-containing protein [Dyadobacter arcticus]NIJ52996.1 putative nuclease of restriction endonuclease-like (RecB) superfamily [Dyadobacter arcticus]
MQKVAVNFDREKIATLSQQMRWSHSIELAGIERDMKREFYGQLAFNCKWTVRSLRDQIDTMLYERSAIAKHPDAIITESLNSLMQNQDLNPDLLFKNTYILEFLNLPAAYSRRILKTH